MTIFKICGITNQPDADAAIAAGATAIGFNFYPRSPRYIAPESAALIATPGVRRIGVFVNEPAPRIAEIARLASLDVAQLHGDETPAHYPAAIAVWKAARVSADFDFSQLDDSPAEALLLDGPAAEPLRRRRPHLRLGPRPRRSPPHHRGRRPRCLQRGARHLARPTLGRRFLLAHRKLAGKKGPHENDRLSARGQGGARRMTSQPDAGGHFGPYGGRYVPEILMAPIEELEAAYLEARDDPAFQTELAGLLHNYAGRPTPLYFAKHLSDTLGGARIWLKREDLLHTGAHKINNCLGQALLARRMGKRRIIAETGAGQHGVATATVCALLGFECVVYMGEEDMRRQRLNVFRMRMLGAKVQGVANGSATLKDAISEAMRDWVTNVGETYYLLGSALGSHPYPMMVRDFHKVIGEEARRQILDAEGRLPDTLIACVGGGSNAIGLFHAFIPDSRRGTHRRRSRRPRQCARRARGALSRRRPRRSPGRLQLPPAG